MHTLIDQLTFDTDFFGIKIGKLIADTRRDVDLGIQQAKLANFDLLYWSTDSNSRLAKIAKKEIPRFVGDQMKYKICLEEGKRSTPVEKDYALKTYDDVTTNEALVNLAIHAGWKSRFKEDPNFTDAQFVRLYKAWIENSCSKKIADTVLTVNYSQGALAGFVTVAISDNHATIGLIAVSDLHRRKGIASALINAAQNYAIENDCGTLAVGTQAANTGANSLYQKMGFAIESSDSFFHLWMAEHQ